MNTVMRFNAAIDFLLQWEKPYITVPEEKAYGLRKSFFPNVDLRGVSVYQAVEYYRAEYWMFLNADRMEWPLAAAFLDTCALFGPSIATNFVKQSHGSYVAYLAYRLEYAASRSDFQLIADHVTRRTANFMLTFYPSSMTSEAK